MLTFLFCFTAKRDKLQKGDSKADYYNSYNAGPNEPYDQKGDSKAYGHGADHYKHEPHYSLDDPYVPYQDSSPVAHTYSPPVHSPYPVANPYAPPVFSHAPVASPVTPMPVRGERPVFDQPSTSQPAQQTTRPSTQQPVASTTQHPITPPVPAFETRPVFEPAPTEDDELPVQTMSPAAPAPAPSMMPVARNTTAAKTQPPTLVFPPENVTNPTQAPVSTADTQETLAPTISPTEETTEAPTDAPTAAIVEEQELSLLTAPPTAFPTTVVLEEQGLQALTVKSDLKIVRAVGVFDPVKSEENFVSAMKAVMAPYFDAYVGKTLQEFTLQVAFLRDYTSVSSDASSGLAYVAMYFEVDVSFEVASTSMDDLTFMTKGQATTFLDQFFNGRHSFYLKRRLNDDGIRVNDIDIVSQLPSQPSAGAESDADDGSASNGRNGNSSSSNAATIYATVFCGAIVVLAIVGVVFFKRRQFHSRTSVALDAMSGNRSYFSSSSGGSSSHLPLRSTKRANMTIKPAAIQLRRQREERGASVASDDSSTGRSQPYSFPETSKLTSDVKAASELNESYHDEPSVRLEELVASSALTSLDPDLDASMTKNYPEFQVYSHLPLKPTIDCPASPVWSVGVASGYSSAADDEEYAADRRRWHDQDNELALISLPDHNSEKGYEYKERPSDLD